MGDVWSMINEMRSRICLVKDGWQKVTDEWDKKGRKRSKMVWDKGYGGMKGHGWLKCNLINLQGNKHTRIQ